MDEAELLSRVRARTAALALNQRELAAACGLSQPHLSKVLKGTIRLAPKTRRALETWLDDAPGRSVAGGGLFDRLLSGPGVRRIQLMQLLELLDRLTRPSP